MAKFAFWLLHAHTFRQIPVFNKAYRVLLSKFKELHLVKFLKTFFGLSSSLRLVDKYSWIYNSAIRAKFAPGDAPEFSKFGKSQYVFVRYPVDCPSNVQQFKIWGVAWLVSRPSLDVIESQISRNETTWQVRTYYLIQVDKINSESVPVLVKKIISYQAD